MYWLIAAEDSDLFDVLAYVAFSTDPHTRAERAAQVRAVLGQLLADPRQAFVDFVLAQHVGQGVEQLDEGNLSGLLKLKYGD